ncbi:hypothetical protein [Paraburkholderia eburnea]|uniref:hypothetical protein n=1 Tax=Paraburkholderia eburnea TaxID=1189126 RepID=UPI001FC94645|nr:hypothetical protein [Paraburkholderia eburnea]
MFRVLHLTPVVLLIARVRREVFRGIEQRDQIVEADAHGRRAIQPTDACDRIVDIAFEHARDVDHIGLEAREEGLANQLRDFAARVVAAKLGGMTGRIPDANVFLREQAAKGGTNGFDRVGQHPAQRKNHLMLATVRHYTLNET